LEGDILVIFARISLILLTLFSLQSQAQTIKESDRFAIIGEPKYAAGFDHYDYANPAAPKGGAITLAAIGTFDNFNRYAMRGNPVSVPKAYTTRCSPPLMMSPAATIR
jgi:microcin C transport system substrate-binding protein